MYDFEKILYENEKILYKGISFPEKGDKNLKGILLLSGFSVLVQFLLIWSTINKDRTGDINISFIIIYLFSLSFLVLAIYLFINNFFLRKINLRGNCFGITNKRVVKYEKKKDKITFGYLVNYNIIECHQIKNGYGDLHFQVNLENKVSTDDIRLLKELKNIALYPNPENMPHLEFEGIENPENVRNLAINARNEVLKNTKSIEEKSILENKDNI